MALTEQRLNDKIEVLNLDAGYPVVQVRTAIIVRRDDQEISRNFHRHVLMPDADLSSEDADVVAIASTVFTDEAKEAYATRPQETP
jgi:L-fucose mutarotase/ribose pyranase (RbsD/FucU family)